MTPVQVIGARETATGPIQQGFVAAPVGDRNSQDRHAAARDAAGRVRHRPRADDQPERPVGQRCDPLFAGRHGQCRHGRHALRYDPRARLPGATVYGRPDPAIGHHAVRPPAPRSLGTEEDRGAARPLLGALRPDPAGRHDQPGEPPPERSTLVLHTVELQGTNFGQFQGAVDLGGKANEDGSLLYRLTALSPMPAARRSTRSTTTA